MVTVMVMVALVGCAGDEPAVTGDDPVETAAAPADTAEDGTEAASPSPSVDDSAANEAETASPSTDDLGALLQLGAWQDRNLTVWRFAADGTYTVQSGQYETGTWELAGTVLTVVTDEATRYCAGTTATYELTAVSTDEIDVEILDDPCEERNESIRAGGLRQFED